MARPVRFRIRHNVGGAQVGPREVQEAPSMRAVRRRFRRTRRFRRDMERQGKFILWCPGEEIRYEIIGGRR